MIQIIPGILAATREEFQQMLNKLQSLAPILQVDISDGVFTPTKLVGLEEIAMADSPRFQVHLMVQNPEEAVLPFLKIQNVESIIFHIEATDKAGKIIDTIQRAGKRAGIALNPETGIEAIAPFAGQADFIQFMMVHPGGYGGEFQSQVLAKMANFHEKYPAVVIEIDGGANPQRVPEMVKAGATMIESGGYIMNSEDPAQAILNLQKSGE
jgi:ribulose-phosphate 3-epimerase